MSDDPMKTEKRYLRAPEAAAHLGFSFHTLAKHRCYGTGPRYHKLGGRIAYTVEDLDAWAATGLQSSTSEPGAGHIRPVHRGRR